jgi:Cyclic nucleotide-binding domain
MTIDDDIAFLERVPTLALLGRDALRILAIGAESRYVHDGDVLFREGEVADAGYVIQEGSFLLASGRPRPGVEPVTVGPGALLGELALLTETVRPATATANEPSSVIRIPRKLFLKMLEGDHHVARPGSDAGYRQRAVGIRRGREARLEIHPSIVAVTGTWSDGRAQPRASFLTVMPDMRSASPGETQM